ERRAEGKPVLYVFSKIVAVSASELEALRVRVGNLLPNSVFVSSVTEDGLDPLRRALLTEARKGTQVAEIWLSASDGRLLAEIYREAKVMSQRSQDGQLVLSVRLDESVAGRLRRAGAKVSHRGGSEFNGV